MKIPQKCECREEWTGVKCPSTHIKEYETIECDECVAKREEDDEEGI